MPNILSRFANFALAALMGLAIAGAQIPPAEARSDEPSTDSGSGKCDKFAPGSRGWKKCMGQLRPSFEEAYALGYWLAKTGDYEQVLGVLRRDADIRDPRVLTMIGYATRHLGHVNEALGYYAKALALNPDATTTRQYLGEAYLQKGEPEKARVQLSEIAARAGSASEDYLLLAKAIAQFQANGRT